MHQTNLCVCLFFACPFSLPLSFSFDPSLSSFLLPLSSAIRVDKLDSEIYELSSGRKEREQESHSEQEKKEREASLSASWLCSIREVVLAAQK